MNSQTISFIIMVFVIVYIVYLVFMYFLVSRFTEELDDKVISLDGVIDQAFQKYGIGRPNFRFIPKKYTLLRLLSKAKYSPFNDTVFFLNIDIKNNITIWVLVHELMHSVQYKTNLKQAKGFLKFSTPYTIFLLIILPTLYVSVFTIHWFEDYLILRLVIFALFLVTILLSFTYKLVFAHKLEVDANEKTIAFFDQYYPNMVKRARLFSLFNRINSKVVIFLSTIFYILVNAMWIV